MNDMDSLFLYRLQQAEDTLSEAERMIGARANALQYCHKVKNNCFKIVIPVLKGTYCWQSVSGNPVILFLDARLKPSGMT